MSRTSRTIFIGAALALALAGCQKSDAPAMSSSGTSPQPVTSAPPVPQMPQADSAAPGGATASTAQDAAERARAMPDSAALQQKSAPQDKMTKEEESKAMPLPGQANDHSTTALEKSKGG